VVKGIQRTAAVSSQLCGKAFVLRLRSEWVSAGAGARERRESGERNGPANPMRGASAAG
jgi:hypothetical protein